MTLGHEKLDVYRLAIGYVAWAEEDTRCVRITRCTVTEGGDFDPDPDSDFDLEKEQPQPNVPGDA